MDPNKTRIMAPGQRPVVGPRDACIVQIYGSDLGRRHPIAGELSVGRGDSNTVIVDDDNVSRRHARFFVDEGICHVEDLGSTNGTAVNDVDLRGPAPLENGDLVNIGGVIFKFILGGNIEGLYHEEIYLLTIIDGLTQIPNQRYFLDFLEREMARAARHGRDLALVIFDVDRFKVLNDTFGHLAGDHVLKKMADMIRREVRRDELFARYGGEEFALVLPETDLEAAAAVAERLRRKVEETVFTFDEQVIRTTISLGIALYTGYSEPLAFIRAADTNLYKAKHGGRNQIAVG